MQYVILLYNFDIWQGVYIAVNIYKKKKLYVESETNFGTLQVIFIFKKSLN